MKKTMKKWGKKRRKGGQKTLNRQQKKCSPYASLHKIGKNTCVTPDMVVQIKNAFNRENPNKPIQTNDTRKIIETIKKEYKCSEDTCWLSTIKNASIRKQIERKIFVPEIPPEWKKNPNEWLSNINIVNVLNQYEEAYPYFRFIGPSPIDFATISNGTCITKEICSLHINNISPKNQIGIIFNLDKHNEPGSHWVSLYIDHSTNQGNGIYYFDSASTDVPNEIDLLMKRFAEESGLPIVSNSVEHQRGNTECGMYSLFFIIHMLLSNNRKKMFEQRFNSANHILKDSDVEAYRRIYFS
jgi:hypothetical protein